MRYISWTWKTSKDEPGCTLLQCFNPFQQLQIHVLQSILEPTQVIATYIQKIWPLLNTVDKVRHIGGDEGG